MADEYDWRMANRLAGIVASDPAHAVDRDVLRRELDVSPWMWKRAFGLAWGRRMIDVCGRWIVLPPR